MKINLFLKGNRLSKSPRRRDREINHVLYNIGQVKSWVDDTFGVHEWSVVLYNELHRSKGLGYHSTVFGFVQGGQNLFLQCWAAHIFDDGRVDMFFDVDRELLGQEMTPVNFVSSDGSVANTVKYDRGGWFTME